MPPSLAVLALGFVLGVRHATDPDHVVAVTTIVSRDRRLAAAARVGAVWGVGHTLTLFVLGGAIVLFGVVVPPRVGLALELAVAAMLVLLGVRNLLVAKKTHVHPHARDSQTMRSLGVGVVHGLAGSAAVALLVLTTIRDARWALAYLLLFGVGTIAGMTLLTTAVALPFSLASGRLARAERAITWVTGAVSVAFGVVLAWHIGFVDGLFAATPHWQPQ